MDLHYYSRVSYARIIAENTGLTMIEEDGIDMPRTDGRRIYVPRYQYSWEPESDEANEWWGKFLHEIYHNDTRYDHPRIFKIMKDNIKTVTKMFKVANNLIEDHRIEYDEYGEFPGRDRIMSSLRKKFFSEFKKNIIEKPTGNPKMDAIYWLQWACFGTWMDDISYIDIRSSLPEETQKYISIVEKYIEPIKGLTTAHECWDLTKKIIDELGDDSPKEEKGESTEEAEGEEGEEVDAEYDKYCPHDHAKREYKEGTIPARVEAKATGYEHTIAQMEEVRPKDISTYDPHSSNIIGRVSTEGLASQIKRYLLVKVQNKTINNQKSGKIDTASLWKASVYRGQSNGSRVFQKDTEHMNLDTAVSLLVDQSGSMSGFRFYNAAAAATTLNEVFSKIGVKTRITSFTDSPDRTYNIVHKDYAEHINKENLVKNFGLAGAWRMSGNADGENILWEFNKIVNRPEKKKLIIVLSDGEPADSKMGDIYQFTYDVIKNIEKSPVGIIGIGIESHAVERFYKRHRVLKDSTQIEATLLDILRNEVLHA